MFSTPSHISQRGLRLSEPVVRGLAALRGCSRHAIESTMALWPPEQLSELRSAGLISDPRPGARADPCSFRLTTNGERVISRCRAR